MVKTKALPGKRFCKKCNKMIPIHSRICGFCTAPQYTMQQITKEYKKRQGSVDGCENPEQFKGLVKLVNPFETSLPHFWSSGKGIKGLIDCEVLTIQLNGVKVDVLPFECYQQDSLSLINVCGESNLVEFSHGRPSFLVVSLKKDPIRYGHLYEGTGIIQVWQVEEKICFRYSVVHNGYTALAMKFLPCQENRGIGTLAVCLANGDLSVYNLPDTSSELIFVQPFWTFNQPGLVFSSLSWVLDSSIAVATQDGSLFIVRPGYSPHIKVFEAHRLPISSLTYSPFNNCIVTTGLDGYLKVWNTSGEILDSLCLSKRWNYHVCCNPVGRFIFFDNDTGVSPHKIAEFKSGQLENKKQISQSTEATVCSCFSHKSSFDYIVTAEGFIELIYVSELEKNSKKRKTPWSRYSRIVWVDSEGNVTTGKNDDKIDRGRGNICHIDLCSLEKHELVAWAGKVCGIYNVEIEDF